MKRKENIKKYYAKKHLVEKIIPKTREDIRFKIYQRNFSRHPNFKGTFEEFIKHFEEQFQGTDYSWENSNEWQIDHIVPLCAGGEHTISNTRPLWTQENLSRPKRGERSELNEL